MTAPRWGLASNRCGFALVEILIVIVLIGLLAGGYFALRARDGQEAEPQFPGEAQTLPGKAIQKGQSVECMNNLNQIRQMLQIGAIGTGKYPPALDPEWGIPPRCPVSGYAYVYDPATGRVYCPTPGHEKY